MRLARALDEGQSFASSAVTAFRLLLYMGVRLSEIQTLKWLRIRGDRIQECVSVTVRIPKHILKQINASLDRKDVPVSHNHWIIEALVEKLGQIDAGGGSNGAR